MSLSYEALEQIAVRTPGINDSVYKDECAFTFTNPESEDGLYVSLYSFLGLSKEHAIRYAMSTQNKAFLHVRRIRIKNDTLEEKPITRLAIGLEGGFQDRRSEKTNDEFQIVIWPEGAVFNIDDPKIPQKMKKSVEGITQAESAFRKEELQATAGTWDGEARQMSKHSENLRQIDNAVRIPPKGWKCSSCDLTDNLWLNLTDGSINCGRAFFNGTGGNNHALEHFKKNGYPLVVKLGTITFKGADVYSYDEDDMVLDSQLQKHLAHFGIDMTAMEKTEKSMAELELDMNRRIGEWAACTEEGCSLIPLFGPGYTGLSNLGNTCYMNSVIQLLFNLPKFTEKYYGEYPKYISSFSGDPNAELPIQMAKMAHGIHSGLYSKKTTDSEEQIGLKPFSFKNVVGKNHPEFSSRRQQDADEYLCHLLTMIDKVEKRNVATNAFNFEVEERLECGKTGKVAYKKRRERVLRLAVPLDKASNANEYREYELRQAEAKKTGEVLDPKSAVMAKISLGACLENFSMTEHIDDFYSSAAQAKVTVKKSTRFLTFPEYLIIQIRKFTISDDWSPKKLDLSLDVPEVLDLNDLLAKGGLQPGEEGMPVGETTAPPSIDEAVVQQLADMGFPLGGCRRAAFHTKGGGVEAAMQWVMEHMNDEDFATPFQSPENSSNNPKIVPDEANIQMVMGMGFSRNHAVRALQETTNNVERAIDWIFSHQEELNQFDETPVEEPELELNKGRGKYSLSGFITHMGSNTSSGHYVCHLLKEGRWVICNDEKVALSEKAPKDLAYIYLYTQDA